MQPPSRRGGEVKGQIRPKGVRRLKGIVEWALNGDDAITDGARRGPRLGRYGNGTEETVKRVASFHTRQSVASRAMSMGPRGGSNLQADLRNAAPSCLRVRTPGYRDPRATGSLGGSWSGNPRATGGVGANIWGGGAHAQACVPGVGANTSGMSRD